MKITSTIRETGEQLAALRSYVQQMNGGEETKSGKQMRKDKDGECDGCCQPFVYIVDINNQVLDNMTYIPRMGEIIELKDGAVTVAEIRHVLDSHSVSIVVSREAE